MILFFLFCFTSAYLLCKNNNFSIHRNIYKLWLSIFVIYIIFVLISHSYISNPFTSFFISRDQLFFYKESIALCNYDFTTIFKRSFNDVQYHELPLAIAIFSSINRIGNYLSVNDLLLFQKFHIAFLTSLIPVYIYKICLLYLPSNTPNLTKQIFAFSILSPLLILSCQLLRDIHICLIFTIMMYVAIKPKVQCRIVILIALMTITYFFRVENGLFSIVFLAIPIYQFYKKSNIILKFTILLISITLAMGFIAIIFNKLNETIQLYTQLTLDEAAIDSLGAKLSQLPFPLNNLSKAVFSQLQPFPIWFPLKWNEPYSNIRIIECFFPVYWIAILFYLIFNCKKIIKSNTTFIKLFLITAFIYIIICSSGGLDIRRIASVYPIILSSFIIMQQQIKKPIKYYLIKSFVFLAALNIIYLIIK